MTFQVGDRITHIHHGPGTVVYVDTPPLIIGCHFDTGKTAEYYAAGGRGPGSSYRAWYGASPSYLTLLDTVGYPRPKPLRRYGPFKPIPRRLPA